MMEARGIAYRLVTGFVHDPVGTQAELIKLIRDDKMNMSEKAKVVETISSYWMSEILGRPDVKKLLTTLHAGDGYNPLFWAFWPGFVKRPVAGWKPTVTELVETIKVMFEIGWSPLDRNKKGENIVQSMREAKTNGYLADIDCDALYDILMHPTRNVYVAVCNSCMNKCTLPTIGNHINALRWVISQEDGMMIFATSLFASAIKTYQGAKEDGFYLAVHNMTEIALNVLAVTKTPADPTFDRFFRQHPWNAAAMIAQFRRIIISQCFETSFVPTGEGDEIIATNLFGEFRSTHYALDAIGAIVGEIGSDADRNDYMRMCLNRGGHLLMHFTVCVVHSARQKTSTSAPDWMTRFQPTLNTLKEHAGEIVGFSRCTILNAISPRCGRALNSIEDLFPELATAPEPAPTPVVISATAEIAPSSEDWEDEEISIDSALYKCAPDISPFLRVSLGPDFKFAVSASGEINVSEGDDAVYSLCNFLRKTPTEDAFIAFIYRTAELIVQESDFVRVNIVLHEAVRRTDLQLQYGAALSRLQSCDFGSIVDCRPVGKRLPSALTL
jgi:hypothetical protein